MNRQLAFVLGGGGARGALQVGALQVLLEAGRVPDLLVGTSAGAINATFLAIHGFSLAGLDQLCAAWRRAAEMDLLPSNYMWATLRSMLRRSRGEPAARIRQFFIDNGVIPDLRFGDLRTVQLIIVSSDLSTGKPVLHGQSPDDRVLDALLISTALPPWFMPVRKQGHYLMDGAVVSGLPVEPALRCGATEIVALDLNDARDSFGEDNDVGMFLSRLRYAVEQRQGDLELQLAQARGVPVTYLSLTARDLIPIWDFRHADELIAWGHQIAAGALEKERNADAVTGRSPS